MLPRDRAILRPLRPPGFEATIYSLQDNDPVLSRKTNRIIFLHSSPPCYSYLGWRQRTGHRVTLKWRSLMQPTARYEKSARDAIVQGRQNCSIRLGELKQMSVGDLSCSLEPGGQVPDIVNIRDK